MIVIDKSYYVHFSFAGIDQTATFYEKDGKIVNPRISISYWKGDQPSLDGLTTIEEIMEEMKKHVRYVRVSAINGLPVWYYNNKKMQTAVNGFCANMEEYIQQQSRAFFEKNLLPIMKKNKWLFTSSNMGIPILAEKDKEGYLQNIQNEEKEKQFEYICKQVLVDSEGRFPIANFIGVLGVEYLTEKNLWVEN